MKGKLPCAKFKEKFQMSIFQSLPAFSGVSKGMVQP